MKYSIKIITTLLVAVIIVALMGLKQKQNIKTLYIR